MIFFSNMKHWSHEHLPPRYQCFDRTARMLDAPVDKCGVLRMFRFSIQPLTILGVTGPFSVLAETIYSLCNDSFGVSRSSLLVSLILC